MSTPPSVMSQDRYVPPAGTFEAFEARYEATGFSPSALALTLRNASRDYAVIVGRQPDVDDRVTRALQKLNGIESSTTYPLLLALFNARAQRHIDSAALAEGVDMLAGFIMRRAICGESSRGYGRMFVRAIPSETTGAVDGLKAYLLDRGWPDGPRFEADLLRYPAFPGYARIVLAALERHPGHREPADLAKATVEHVMPQTLTEEWRGALGVDADRIRAEWLHTIGNLTLSAYNAPLSNHSFAAKRKIYADSNIGITKALSEVSVWGEAQIIERGQQLASVASRIWSGPDQPRPPAPRPSAGPAATVEEICALADANGIGVAYRALVQACVSHGLYARSAPNSRTSIMFTLPTMRTRSLLFAVATPLVAGKVRLWAGSDATKALAEYFPVTPKQVLGVQGTETQLHISADEMPQFLSALDRLFDLINNAKNGEMGPTLLNSSTSASDGDHPD